MLVTAIAALSLLGAQVPDLDRKVTFSSVAKDAKRMLIDLSEKAGVQLLTSQAIQSDILVIQVKDAPLKELMAKIADVSLADWKPEGVGYRLVPNPTKEQRSKADELARRTADATELIARLKKDVSSEPFTAAAAKSLAESLIKAKRAVGGSDEDYSLWNRLSTLSRAAPTHQLAWRLFTQLDPVELAKVETGGRAVFSTRPNRMQRPFKGAEQAMARFVADQELWVKTAKDALEQAGEDEGGAFSALDDEPLPGSGPFKVLLTFAKSSGEDLAGVKVFDAEGNMVASADLDLSVSYDEQGDEDKDAGLKPAPGEKPIEYSELSRAWIAHREMAEAERLYDKPPPAALLAYFSNPAENEPLALLPSDQLLGLAKAKGLNLVAHLDDDALEGIGWGDNEVTPSQVAGYLNATYRTSTAAGWLTAAPMEPCRARFERTDRVALTRLFRAAEAKKRLAVDDMAAFALTTHGEDNFGQWSTFVSRMIVLAIPAAYDGGASQQDIEALRLYGSLNAPQRQALASTGGRVAFSSLNPLQREIVERIVFGGDSIKFLGEPILVEGSPIFMDGQKLRKNTDVPDLYEEPTELMPNGLPADGYLTMETTKEEIAYGYEPKSGQVELFTTENMAYDVLARDHPQEFGNPDWPRTPWAGYRLGARRCMDITFNLPKGGTSQKVLNDDSVDHGNPLVPYTGLPESFRKKVDEEVERQLRYRSMFSSPGTKKVPPPRR